MCRPSLHTREGGAGRRAAGVNRDPPPRSRRCPASRREEPPENTTFPQVRRLTATSQLHGGRPLRSAEWGAGAHRADVKVSAGGVHTWRLGVRIWSSRLPAEFRACGCGRGPQALADYRLGSLSAPTGPVLQSLQLCIKSFLLVEAPRFLSWPPAGEVSEGEAHPGNVLVLRVSDS